MRKRTGLSGIQQTLAQIDWSAKPLCKSLVLFLLVVVAGKLECTVQLSVARAAATTIKSSVLKLTMAVSQLFSFPPALVPQLLLFYYFNKKECENTSAAFAVMTSPRAPRPPRRRPNNEHIAGVRCSCTLDSLVCWK